MPVMIAESAPQIARPASESYGTPEDISSPPMLA